MCVVCCVFVCVRALEFFFFWCVFHFILSCSRCKAEQSIHTSCIATERSERFVRWSQKKQQQNTYQYGKRAQIVVCAIRFPSQCSLNMWLYVDVDFIFIYISIYIIYRMVSVVTRSIFSFLLVCASFYRFDCAAKMYRCWHIQRVTDWHDGRSTIIFIKTYMHRPHYRWHFC